MAVVHYLSSLDEIDGLDAPHPDVVLVTLERLRDFPAALERLELNNEAHDWCTINITQVRVASSLATLIVKAEGRMGAVARALQRMKEACDELEKASLKVQNYCPGMVGQYGILLAGNNPIGRLDEAHQDISNLLQGPVATARAQRYMGMNQDSSLRNMEHALITLRDINRSVVRRVRRLQRVVTRLEVLKRWPTGESNHALSKADPVFRQIAATIYESADGVLGYLTARNKSVRKVIKLINTREQEVTQQLDMALGLKHERYSGTLQLRSLRDLTEAFLVSTPHQDNIAPRPISIQLCGLNVLSDAHEMDIKVAEGSQQWGWTVQGLTALATARELDNSLVALRPALRRLLETTVMDTFGVIVDPVPFDVIAEHAKTLMFDSDSCIDCEGAAEIASMVLDISKAPEHQRRHKIGDLLALLEFARGEIQVIFNVANQHKLNFKDKF